MSKFSKILVTGSGPIIIGQVVEFGGYAGTKADKGSKGSLERMLQPTHLRKVNKYAKPV